MRWDALSVVTLTREQMKQRRQLAVLTEVTDSGMSETNVEVFVADLRANVVVKS